MQAVPRPRRLFSPWSVATFSITGVLVLSLVTFGVGFVPAALAFAAAFAALPVYALAVLALDRLHPEPPAVLWWAFLAGATTVTFSAAILNDVFGLLLELAFGEALGEILTLSVVAPVVEEAGKALVLVVLLVRYLPRAGGILSGLVLSSMVGLGFSTVENVFYYGEAFAAGEALGALFARGVLSPFAHPLFAAMFGIGFALYRERPYGWRRFAPWVGLAVGMVLHGLWNGSTQVAEGFGFLIVFVVLMVPLFAAIVVVALVAGQRERRLFWERLGPELAAGLLTPADLRVLSSTSQRRTLISSVRRTDRVAASALRDLSMALLDVAFARERLRTAPPGPHALRAARQVGELEARILSLRRSLPWPPPHLAHLGLVGVLRLPPLPPHVLSPYHQPYR